MRRSPSLQPHDGITEPLKNSEAGPLTIFPDGSVSFWEFALSEEAQKLGLKIMGGDNGHGAIGLLESEIVEDFPGHAGRPGLVGGSVPKDAIGGSGKGLELVLEKTDDKEFYSASKEKVIIYSQDGKELVNRSGIEYRVDLSDIYSKDIQNAHLVHIHPDDKDYGYDLNDTWTFSANDIETAFDGNLASMTATGNYRTYIMERPSSGWGSYSDAIAKTSGKLKYSEKYVRDILKFRRGVFGDNPIAMNKAARKFWKAFAEEIGAAYTETTRKAVKTK